MAGDYVLLPSFNAHQDLQLDGGTTTRNLSPQRAAACAGGLAVAYTVCTAALIVYCCAVNEQVLFIAPVNLVVPVAVYRQALLRYGGAQNAGALSTQEAETQPLLGSGSDAGKGWVDGGVGARAGEQEMVQAVPDWVASCFPGGRVRLAEVICVTVSER